MLCLGAAPVSVSEPGFAQHSPGSLCVLSVPSGLQVIWSTSRRLGCWQEPCDVPGSTSGKIWVCHYDPIGNVPGQFPYGTSSVALLVALPRADRGTGIMTNKDAFNSMCTLSLCIEALLVLLAYTSGAVLLCVVSALSFSLTPSRVHVSNDSHLSLVLLQ